MPPCPFSTYLSTYLSSTAREGPKGAPPEHPSPCEVQLALRPAVPSRIDPLDESAAGQFHRTFHALLEMNSTPATALRQPQAGRRAGEVQLVQRCRRARPTDVSNVPGVGTRNGGSSRRWPEPPAIEQGQCRLSSAWGCGGGCRRQRCGQSAMLALVMLVHATTCSLVASPTTTRPTRRRAQQQLFCEFDELVSSIETHVASGGNDGSEHAALWERCRNLRAALAGTDRSQAVVRSVCATAEPQCDWLALVDAYLLQGETQSLPVLQTCGQVRDSMAARSCELAPSEDSGGNTAEPPLELVDSDLTPGDYNLPVSGDGELVTLVQVPSPTDTDTEPGADDGGRRRLAEGRTPRAPGSAVPVARSYNGNDWEGSMPSPLSFSCNQGTCATTLPTNGDYTYELRVFSATQIVAPSNAEKVASRFLTQATFGPKLHEIRALAADDENSGVEETEERIEEWVHSQIFDVEPSLHRIYMRRRFNLAITPATQYTSPMRAPCAEGSSWLDIAFSRVDRGKAVGVSLTPGGLYALSIDGVVRTVVDSVTDIRATTHHNCYKRGFRTPLDGLHGYESSEESSVETCHARCVRTEGCSFFSFLPAPGPSSDYDGPGRCHLQSGDASTIRGNGGRWRTGSRECVPYQYPAADVPGLQNMDVSCWEQCGAHGPCPTFCGENGYCCRYTRDLNGCVTTDPTKTTHRCIPDPSMPPPPPAPAPVLEPGQSYILCYATEYKGGDLQLLKPGTPLPGGDWKVSSCQAGPADMIVLENPIVALEEPDMTITQQLDGVTMERITVGAERNRYVARNMPEHCSLPETMHAFLQDATGKYYRHEPRLELVTNTVDQPNIERSRQRDKTFIPSLTPTFCPAATQSFANRRGCIRRNACAEPEFSSGTVLLDDELMTQLFRRSSKYVYYIRGLRVEGLADADISPCLVSSRWVKSTGSCEADTPLDDATRTALTDALQLNTVLDTTHVRIVDPPGELPLSNEDWVECASEGGTCACSGFVRYGADGMWSDAQPSDSDISCTNAVFGDPAPSTAKRCECTATSLTCTTQLNGVSAVGASLTIGDTCFRHVHPDEYNVYDFSYWTDRHPGNSVELAAGRANPIQEPARVGDTAIDFPDWHGIDRWPPVFSARNPTPLLRKLGVYGEEVEYSELPTTVQTKWLAEAAGVVDLSAADELSAGSLAGIQTEACGSFGEVDNRPELGHKYGGRYVWAQKPTYEPRSMLWVNAVFHSQDQLRQRVAWGLNQIYIVSKIGFDPMTEEPWAAYYDIFVRHAFGNFREMLQEVSYAFPMGKMLTFAGSQSAASSGNFADENFARESIQLFTVGLYHLHQNGTRVLDGDGNPQATYDVKDVASFARAWTGFVQDSGNLRSNAAAASEYTDQSANVDPMRISPTHRDASPKMHLLDGYIGDGFPACRDMPHRPFLRKGAHYAFLGSRLRASDDVISLSLQDHSSALYQELCGSASADGPCAFRGEVTLTTSLPCHGNECPIDRAHFVEVVDASGRVGYYEFVPTSCANFPFFEDGRVVKYGSPWYNDLSCSDQKAVAAAPMCCSHGDNSTDGTGEARCHYSQERVTYQTAVDRCAAAGKGMCYGNHGTSMGSNMPCHPFSMWRYSVWLDRPCSTQVQIQRDGRVSVVHSGARFDNTRSDTPRIEPEEFATVISVDSKSIFDVVWFDGVFPRAETGCSDDFCTLHGETCVCDVEVHSSAVFTDTSHLPSREQLSNALHIGAIDPAAYDNGEYVRCTAAICSSDSDVEVWTKRVRVHEALGAPIDLVNVALDKPTVHSSVMGQFASSRIVDGDTSNLFHSQCTGEQWVQVDLEAVTRIDHIRIWHRVDCCGTRINGATIIVSSSPDYMAGVQCGGPLVHENPSSLIDCEGLSGRYVTVRQDGQCLQVNELEVLKEGILTQDGYIYAPELYDFEPAPSELTLDEHTVFAVRNEDGRAEFFKNQESRVSVQDFSFRNPPTLINYEHPTVQECETETNAVLDHLANHPSTAPFVCQKLIQRLTSSNPSPRYVQEVVTAFRTGVYNGHEYSGQYGDLGAAVAAIFLDREARDSTLDLDPAAGKLREPLLKVMHLLRSLEFEPRDGIEFELAHMQNKIGMYAYQAPSIFNFYLPDHVPAGPASTAMLFAPEAEILSTPFLIGYLNGVASLVDNGLTGCDRGFAWGSLPTYNPHMYLAQDCATQDTKRLTNEGELSFMAERQSSLLHDASTNILEELSLLLTAGRIPAVAQEYYDNAQRENAHVQYLDGPKNVFDTEMCTGTQADWSGTLEEAQARCSQDPDCGWLHHAMVDTTDSVSRNWRACGSTAGMAEPAHATDGSAPTAQTMIKRRTDLRDVLPTLIKTFAFSTEFHATNINSLTTRARPALPEIPSQDRPYKAIVVLFLEGGADSFSMLIPLEGCSAGDLYGEYAAVRGNVALTTEQILPMSPVQTDPQFPDAPEQPCTTFGTHPSLGIVQTLWEAGEASWFANMGSLVEPLTLEQWNTKRKDGRAVRIPPSLFGHDTQQRQCQSVHSDNTGATGVLGRIVEAMTTQAVPYRSSVYSIYGIRKLVEGAVPPTVMSVGGIDRFAQFDQFRGALNEITGRESMSVFADTYSGILEKALEETERLGAQMLNVTLIGNYGDTGLENVARTIALRSHLAGQGVNSERDVFMVGKRTFDSHQNSYSMNAGLLASFNQDLTALHADLTAIGMWEQVVVLTISDFARTLTSNGLGTDHAWGGNYFMMGGDVKGQRIHGAFPDDLDPTTSQLEVGRGRGVLIPSVPWEGMWWGVAQWFGVSPEQMAHVLPNAENFVEGSTLFTKEQLFRGI